MKGIVFCICLLAISAFAPAQVLWPAITIPARLPQNRGTDGLFTAAAWLPKASVLIGPVTIQGTQTIK